MTFGDKSNVVGRQAASILELELDGCSNSYGLSPCTATLALSNFARNSEDIDTGGWSKNSVTIVANVKANPLNGAIDADEMIESNSGGGSTQHRINRATVKLFQLDDWITLSWNMFLGDISLATRMIQLVLWEGGGNVTRAWFNIDEGAVGTVSAGGTSISESRMYAIPGEPGWYRIMISSIIDPANVTPTSVNIGLQIANGNGASFHTSNDTSSVIAWGAQVRQGRVPGKYIQNSGTDIDGMGSADDLCFNTFGTCQDPANYVKSIPPAGSDVDFDIVNVDDSIATPDVSYVDVDPAFQIDQANLINGDEYLILVQSYIMHSISTSLSTNFVRLVDESGVELTGSEYRFEAPDTGKTVSGLSYQYANWITAAPGVGDGLIQMQAQQTQTSGSVLTNGFRSFAINLTQMGADHFVRARRSDRIAGISDSGFTEVESVTLPTDGDYAIYTCVQCDTFSNTFQDISTRIRHNGSTTLFDFEHDVDDTSGIVVFGGWTVLEGASAGDTIELEQTSDGAVTYDNTFASIIAIRLDRFAKHFIFTGDPTDPPGGGTSEVLNDTFAVDVTGNYLWFGSLAETWPGSGFSGSQRINVDIDGGGDVVVSGDQIYSAEAGDNTLHWARPTFPNAVIALTAGQSIDVNMDHLAAPSPTNNDLFTGAVWGFALNVPSEDISRTQRFIDVVARPVGAVDIYPSIKSVRYGATQLRPGGKFSVRGVVNVTLQDFAHNDINVDDYQEERSFNQEDQGTFFGKFKERNKFYIGRPMRVLEGYLNDPFSLDNFRTREYIIENIEGPTAEGVVRITGKDILALARNDRSKAPEASTETLRASMTSGQTTMLPQLGEGAGIFAGDKHVRIDDEIIAIVSHTPTDTLNVTRAQGGTTAAAHNVDATIQECLTFADEPVIDVINTLLTTFANVPASFIPTADWETEESESLTGYDLTTIISSPTGVTKLLQEICEITLIDLWYSDVDQEIKLKLQTPFTTVTETWDDDDNIVADSIRVKDLNDQRLSRVLIYYGRRNFARDKMEPENYSFVNFEIEADKEGVNKYDDEKIRTIFSSWFDLSNAVQVALTSQRLLARFGITPIEVTFDIDAKDVELLQTGDVYDLNTRVIQDVNGLPKTTRFQIVETKPVNVGHKYKYKSLAFFQDPTPTSLTISSNETDYDIFVELGGPPAAVDVTVTVDAAVFVDATNGNPAMKTDGMHPDSTLELINNGNIRGYGGNGGNGGSVSGLNEFEPGIGCIGVIISGGGNGGQPGGDALNITIESVTIDNTNGNIFGGAGAGGGGGSDRSLSDLGGGGGGGGGLGTDTGNAGGGGSSSVSCSGPGCGCTNTAGTGGSAATDSSEGTGGAGGASAGAGAAGGTDWGEAGTAGTGSSGGSGGSGGAGGNAVRLNGASIVWEGGNNPTQVKGGVS